MSFYYPLAFLGLLIIPVLILIYIIKNKYTEQTVSSTYLWTLSEKFIKRKNPISKLVGIISLILQIILVAVICIAAARPVFTLANAADSFCFVLDASGSMNISEDGTTRFERGKQEIASLISGSTYGSVYTLVLANGEASTVFEGVKDKEQAIKYLDNLQSGYSVDSTENARSVAQEYFNADTSLKTYLVTDKAYNGGDKVKVINVSKGAENYAVSNVTYVIGTEKTQVKGSAISYESDASINLALYIDDEKAEEKTVELKKLESTAFEFTAKVTSFKKLSVKIDNADALALDNDFIVYNIDSQNSYKTLLVSDTPFFLQSAIESCGSAELTVIETAKYSAQTGYDLYIFDSCEPVDLPRDGAVWLVNPTGNFAGAGFSVQGKIELDKSQTATYSNSSSTLMATLLEGVSRDDINVKRYIKCGIHRNFSTILSLEGNPLLFVGNNEYGNRQAVFAFDLHDSPIVLLKDYGVLVKNILSYSFPSVITSGAYYCGDIMQINAVAGSKSIRIDSPLGNVTYLDTGFASTEFAVEEAGTYKITVLTETATNVFYAYAAVPEEERAVSSVTDKSFRLDGTATTGGHNGIYDDLMVYFILLALIFAADWMVYCYEQYQLR